jgi:hypothetical protein
MLWLSLLVGSTDWDGVDGGPEFNRNRNKPGCRPDGVLCDSRSGCIRPRSLLSLCDRLCLSVGPCRRGRLGSRCLSRPHNRRDDRLRPCDSRGSHEDNGDDSGGG